MRPITKGENHKQYNKYQDAKQDLIDCIGPYCSYCERHLIYNIAIEHIQPKSIHPDLELEWSNFLIACPNCNSHKKDKDINSDNIRNYVWPHIDDTYHLIEYDDVTSLPKPRKGLNRNDTEKVNNTIKLTGLDIPISKIESKTYEQMSDTRTEDRIKCIKEAKEYLQIYKQGSEDAKEQYLELFSTIIKESGYWSIWMHYFEKEPKLKELLINLLPGTRTEFFK